MKRNKIERTDEKVLYHPTIILMVAVLYVIFVYSMVIEKNDFLCFGIVAIITSIVMLTLYHRYKLYK